MIKFFSILGALLATPGRAVDLPCGPGARIDWRRDPLAHPDLMAMSERQLADLPLSGHDKGNRFLAC